MSRDRAIQISIRQAFVCKKKSILVLVSSVGRHLCSHFLKFLPSPLITDWSFGWLELGSRWPGGLCPISYSVPGRKSTRSCSMVSSSLMSEGGVVIIEAPVKGSDINSSWLPSLIFREQSELLLSTTFTTQLSRFSVRSVVGSLRPTGLDGSERGFESKVQLAFWMESCSGLATLCSVSAAVWSKTSKTRSRQSMVRSLSLSIVITVGERSSLLRFRCFFFLRWIQSVSGALCS